MGGGGAAVAAEEPVKDRSGTSRMNDLGLFSDLNYTTINDRYDDIGLRRMLNSRLGARAPPAVRRCAAPPRSSQPPLRLQLFEPAEQSPSRCHAVSTVELNSDSVLTQF